MRRGGQTLSGAGGAKLSKSSGPRGDGWAVLRQKRVCEGGGANAQGRGAAGVELWALGGRERVWDPRALLYPRAQGCHERPGKGRPVSLQDGQDLLDGEEGVFVLGCMCVHTRVRGWTPDGRERTRLPCLRGRGACVSGCQQGLQEDVAGAGHGTEGLVLSDPRRGGCVTRAAKPHGDEGARERLW